MRGEDENAEVDTFLSNLAQYVEAVAAGKREVEEEQLRSYAVNEKEAFLGGRRRADIVACRLDTGDESRGELAVVFDDQNGRLRGWHRTPIFFMIP